MTNILVGIIRVYQRVSRHLPAQCRFHPTCSEYAAQALTKHGWFRGVILATRRIFRCNPFSAGGFDPVP